MNRYTVRILGTNNYIADSLDDAKSMAEKDIKYIHPKWDVHINGTLDLGPIGKD